MMIHELSFKPTWCDMSWCWWILKQNAGGDCQYQPVLIWPVSQHSCVSAHPARPIRPLQQLQFYTQEIDSFIDVWLHRENKYGQVAFPIKCWAGGIYIYILRIYNVYTSLGQKFKPVRCFRTRQCISLCESMLWFRGPFRVACVVDRIY